MGERIQPGERSGVLHPENLARYRANWIAPHPAVADVIDHYWHVEWNLGVESIPQRIVAAPAVTLTLERGAVPAPLVITGVHRRAWQREIAGWGRVFGIRLRPAGLGVLSDLLPDAIADATLPVTPRLDARLHALLAALPLEAEPETQARSTDGAVRSILADRPVDPLARLANNVVAELGANGPRPVGALAQHFGTSERTIQRALKATLGQGPAWVGRWIRLQEVVRLLSTGAAASEVAASLGYVDQAHLVNDFRAAVGMTPGAYVRSLRALAG